MQRSARGFTLIELMIVVAVVGLLAAIAYPSYTAYVKRANRAAAVELMSEGAQSIERFYSRNGTYADGTNTLAAPGSTTYYDLAFSGRTATAWTLTATPKGMMAGDGCGNFILDNTGARSVSGSIAPATCWGR